MDFSFLLNNEEAEALIQLNPNFFETNVINIGLLIGILIYANKTSFSVGLENRQKEIIQTIENAQKDVVNASNYYYLAEKGFTQSLFWLQSWKNLYEKDKVEIVETKYKLVKTGLTNTFSTTENLIKNFENKAFVALQRYMVLITASRILRKFLFLSEAEQSKLIDATISKLGGFKKMSITKKVVTTYAKSLFQNVNVENNLNKSFEVSKITSAEANSSNPNVYIIGEELLLIKAVLNSSKKLHSFFNNPTYAEQQKLDVLLSIFPGLTTTTKSFLKILTERSHLALLPEVSTEFNRLLSKFKNISNVKLIVASILQEKSGSTLLETLKELTQSKEVVLNVSYNPKLLGGLVLEYNSAAIDASILKEFSLFFNDI